MADLVQDDRVVDREEGNGEERRVGLGAVPVHGAVAQRLLDTEHLLVITPDAKSFE